MGAPPSSIIRCGAGSAALEPVDEGKVPEVDQEIHGREV
jgi:hypothetical protein